MSMLNPNQKELVNKLNINSLNGKTTEEQAQKIADYCNNNGITKEQLENIRKMF